jgi:hypothetical protein
MVNLRCGNSELRMSEMGQERQLDSRPTISGPPRMIGAMDAQIGRVLEAQRQRSD